MYDLDSVYRGLLYSEVLRASDLYISASEHNHHGLDLVGIIYKCGLLDGRERERKRANAAHRALHEYKQMVAAKYPEIVNQPTPGVVKEETSNE